MLSWEHSDHPVAVWNVPPSGQGVDGVNILTLNEHFADECVPPNPIVFLVLFF